MFSNYLGARKSFWWGLRGKTRGGNKGTEVAIHLVSVDVKGTLVHTAGQVQVVQIYKNEENESVDTVYKFPLNDTMTLTSFEAEVNEKLLQGKVTPVTVSNFKELTASLGINPLSKNCLQVNVGILQPGDRVKITVGFINSAKIRRLTGCIIYTIPLSIVPSMVAPKHDETIQQSEGSQKTTLSSAILSLELEVRMRDGIISIRSPSHLVNIGDVEYISSIQGYKASVKYAGRCDQMNTNFVVNTLAAEGNKPSVYSEDVHNGSTAIMVHTLPQFEYNESKSEFILILDKFCYKTGRQASLAKKAITLFLHSLPSDSHFNIVTFGAVCRFLFPQSVLYNDRSLNLATTKIECITAEDERMDAGYGLEEVFEKQEVKGYMRQIFFISSAKTINTDRVAGLIQRSSDRYRVFAIGIKNEPHFNEEVIRVGGATTVYIGENDRIDTKLMDQLKIAVQPSQAVVQLLWRDPTGQKCSEEFQSPNRIPLLSSGSDFIAFSACPTSISRKGQNDEHASTKVQSVENNLAAIKSPPFFNLLHLHTAWKFILEMELELAGIRAQDEDIDILARVKKNIVDVSTIYNVPSKYTLFVVTGPKNLPCGIAFQCRRSQHLPGIRDGLRGIKRRYTLEPNRDHTYFSSLYGSAKNNGTLKMFENESMTSFEAMINSLVEGDLEIWLMYELIELQSAEGYFTLHAALCAILGKKVGVLQAAAFEEHVTEYVFATALAVSIFNKKMGSERDQWDLIISKAEQWLKVAAPAQTIKNILGFAHAIIKK